MTDIWSELREFSQRAGRVPGMCIETSLLGPVSYTRHSDGGFIGTIPHDLAIKARRNGFEIEVADYKRGVYVLRILDQHKPQDE